MLLRPPSPVTHGSTRVEQDGAPEQWEAISDLDGFFTRVYVYYHEKGLRCMLASRIIGLLMLGWTILFTVFLTELLNWHDLLYKCFDEASCHKVSAIKPDALRQPSLLFVVYLSLFSLYWLWTFLAFCCDLRPLLEMRALFRDKLHIDDVALQVATRPAWRRLPPPMNPMNPSHRVAAPPTDATHRPEG